jgi:hypothetical protein
LWGSCKKRELLVRIKATVASKILTKLVDCVKIKRYDCDFSRTLFGDSCALAKDNYAHYFHSLLYLDEYEALQSLERYNMSNVPLKIVIDTHLELEVSCITLCLMM